MKEILEEHWHHLPEAEVVDFLETAMDKGLDTFEVGHRQSKFGPNMIIQKKGTSPLVLFLLQFHQPLVYILLAAAVVTSIPPGMGRCRGYFRGGAGQCRYRLHSGGQGGQGD